MPCCAGAQFSDIEQRVLLAMMLRNYEFESVPEAGDELIYSPGIVLTPLNCKVRLIPRLTTNTAASAQS
jgi:cytochrome P450